MWGKRQRDDDWDGDRRDQPDDRREQRPDDRRDNGYWGDADEWGGPGGNGFAGGGAPAGNGNRQGFGNADRPAFGDAGRPGFGDADRQGFGESPWGEPRRGRGDYSDGSFGGPGFGDLGRDAGRDASFGGGRPADSRPGDPWQPDPRQGDARRPARDFPEPGFGQQTGPRDFPEPGFGQQTGPRDFPEPGFGQQPPPRDFPEPGFGQQPGYGGGRGADFGGGDFGGDYRGGDRREQDRREADRRDLDRRDLDRRDGGGPRGEAGGWAAPEVEMPAPMFTPAPQAPSAAPALSSSGSGGSRPYGRLLIFTLHDDRAAEFDRLAEQAAEGVRALEPDTLVYVMHVVPKAPLQRIIYEIYRDHTAFEAHQRQPHIQQFEDGRKSCVLVTNIIDLRLKYAKVAPLQGAGQPNGAQSGGSQPNGSQLGGSQPAPGARHRGPQAPEPEGAWYGGEPAGPRSPDLDGDRTGERVFDSGDRRSQDWGPSQYTGQRYRNN